jgi:hypothetical protein
MVLLASDYDQSRFFKAADFNGERRMRIKNVTEEVIGVGAEKEPKLVVWFTTDKRGLPLNKTNNRTLRGAFGDDVDGWKRKIIIIFPTTTDLRGKMVGALRVRIPPPKHGQAAVSEKPKASGNGPKAVTAKPKLPVDEETDDVDEPPAQPHTTAADDFDDEVDF